MTLKKSFIAIAKTTAPKLVNDNTVAFMLSSKDEKIYTGINNVSSHI